MRYGGQRPVVALSVSDQRVRVAVGERVAEFPSPLVGNPDLPRFSLGVLDESALAVHDGDAVLDVVALDAPPLAYSWVNAETVVVLDAGGHVSFWRWD